MKKIFEPYQIKLSDEQILKLNKYYQLLIEWNEKINLTSITNYDEVVKKHFLDSALIMSTDIWKDNSINAVLDVGTGAGFPGMVLAILNPNIRFVLLDSINKRIDFLDALMDELAIKNVETYHGRAEVYARNEKFRNKFDFVVSRAVAELPVLMEYCIPFVKKNGYFVSYKGKKQEEELEKTKNAFRELDASLGKVEKFNLQDNEERFLLFIKNNCETKDKYPRKEGKPKKKPL